MIRHTSMLASGPPPDTFLGWFSTIIVFLIVPAVVVLIAVDVLKRLVCRGRDMRPKAGPSDRVPAKKENDHG